MSFFDCVADAVDEGSLRKEKGEEAQRIWKERSTMYERAGYDRHTAESLAATDVKIGFKKKAAEDRNRALGIVAATNKMNLTVKEAKDVSNVATDTMTRIDYEKRSIVHFIHGRIGAYLKEHRPNLMGQTKASFQNVVRELHGQQTGDEAARVFAESITDAREWLRTRLNATGHNIGKLDNRGLRHQHDRIKITKVGFDKWFSDIREKIDWTRINDDLTGRPLAESGAPSMEIQTRFLKEVYDNIAYGKGTKKATYGRIGTGRALERERVLHFKKADDWIEYNKAYGQTDPFNSIVIELEHLSRELAASNHLGPDKMTGIEYMRSRVMEETRTRQLPIKEIDRAERNTAHAVRMMKVYSGGVGPSSIRGAIIAKFFSNARKLFSSAALDRAVIISVPSDLNSMRLAAQAIKMNPTNVLSRYVDLMAEAVQGGGITHDDLLRQGWIADSIAGAASTGDRFDTQWGVSQWADVLSNATMRIQGLNAHTDELKAAWQISMSGHLAAYADKALSDVEPKFQKAMRDHGITDVEWDIFRKTGMYEADNGAKFLNPLYWRAAVDMDHEVADQVFLKMQSFIESMSEMAVPTNSLHAKAFFDPSAFDLTPGSAPYEVLKSGGMFKSFPAAFMMNQIHAFRMREGFQNKFWYGFDLLATSTLVGAIGIQVNDLLFGRDPQNMADPWFLARAFVKGGGVGILGDIAATGQTSWGGGLPGYAAGPMFSAAQDIYDLTAGNISDFAHGKDMNLAKDITWIGKRYLPMGQTPLALGGAAIDRLFWDQLQIILDPDSVDALVKASKKRDENYGGGTWWVPGQVLPGRGPNLMNAIGQ